MEYNLKSNIKWEIIKFFSETIAIKINIISAYYDVVDRINIREKNHYLKLHVSLLYTQNI